jgi:hypothetical protein
LLGSTSATSTGAAPSNPASAHNGNPPQHELEAGDRM